MFQSMLEYKLKWFGLQVKYVNPANLSITCLSAYWGRLMIGGLFDEGLECPHTPALTILAEL